MQNGSQSGLGRTEQLLEDDQGPSFKTAGDDPFRGQVEQAVRGSLNGITLACDQADGTSTVERATLCWLMREID